MIRMKELVINAVNISKNFPELNGIIHVLKEISIQIYRKDKIFIWGSSGSGKTTLLQILGGLIPPTEGELEIFSENIYQIDLEYLNIIKNRISWIFQNPILLNSLTVLENIFLIALHRNNNYNEVYNEIKSLASNFGVEKLLFRFPDSLSMGERQRISIIRGIVANPWILFIDEPSAFLDERSKDPVIELFLSLVKERNTTLIVATHDPRFRNIDGRHFEITGKKLLKI